MISVLARVPQHLPPQTGTSWMSLLLTGRGERELMLGLFLQGRDGRGQGLSWLTGPLVRHAHRSLTFFFLTLSSSSTCLHSCTSPSVVEMHICSSYLWVRAEKVYGHGYRREDAAEDLGLLCEITETMLCFSLSFFTLTGLSELTDSYKLF